MPISLRLSPKTVRPEKVEANDEERQASAAAAMESLNTEPDYTVFFAGARPISPIWNYCGVAHEVP